MQLLTCEELISVWTVQKSIEKEQRRLFDLHVLAAPRDSRLASPRLDGMPHSKPCPVNFERIAGLIIDCQHTIDSLGEILALRKFELLSKLQSLKLKELQHRVLSYHYVACLPFKDIAKLMHCSYTYVQILHRKGLKSIGLSVDELNLAKNNAIFVA